MSKPLEIDKRYGHEFKWYNQSYMKPYAFLLRYYASVELNQ